MITQLHGILRTLPLRSGLLAAVAMLAVTGCRSIATKSELHGTLLPSKWESFAWAVDTGTGDEALDSEVRSAVERELSELGFMRAEPNDADLLISFQTSIEKGFRNNDPFFAHWPAEGYEMGTLTIWMQDALDGELIWSGSGTSEIRVSDALLGPFATKLTPTDNPRNWRVEKKVREILENLGRKLAAAN